MGQRLAKKIIQTKIFRFAEDLVEYARRDQKAYIRSERAARKEQTENWNETWDNGLPRRSYRRRSFALQRTLLSMLAEIRKHTSDLNELPGRNRLKTGMRHGTTACQEDHTDEDLSLCRGPC